MTDTTASNQPAKAGKPLVVGLWCAQTFICLSFVVFGYMKATYPIAMLASMWKWPGDLPAWFVRTMGVVDALGGLGVMLPALTRIMPRLTVWAALGCTVLQLCAITFHTSRGEYQALPLNFILLPICAFILWGRAKKHRSCRARDCYGLENR